MNEIYKESLNDNEIIQKDDCIIWIPCFEKIQHLKTNKITFSNINNNSIVDEYIKFIRLVTTLIIKRGIRIYNALPDDMKKSE